MPVKFYKITFFYSSDTSDDYPVPITYEETIKYLPNLSTARTIRADKITEMPKLIYKLKVKLYFREAVIDEMTDEEVLNG